jgi:hypothetical protein
MEGRDFRMRKQNVLSLAVGTVAVFAGTAAVNAASLVTFDAVPTSSNLPEFQLQPQVVPELGNAVFTEFSNGAGSVGNGLSDGLLSESAQVVGGLGIETPLHVVIPSAIPLSTGGTAFDDVTLIISDLGTAGNAIDVGSGDPGDLIIQPLGAIPGLGRLPTFAMYATSLLDSNPLHGQLLLTGTISKASLTALNAEDTAGVLSSKVTYTGGAIYDALVATPGAITSGSLSWSLLDVHDNLGNPSVTIDPGTNLFTNFQSNGSGLFSTPNVPEPTSAVK